MYTLSSALLLQIMVVPVSNKAMILAQFLLSYISRDVQKARWNSSL